jgi:hypothetical protein
MDPYQLLGVHPQSPREEIEQAFQRAAHVNHPNNGGDPQRFAAIVEAYKRITESLPPSTQPRPAPQQSQVKSETYILGPKINAIKGHNAKSTLVSKLIALGLATTASLISSYMFNGFSLSVTGILISALLGLGTFFLYDDLFVAFFKKNSRIFLYFAGIGLVTWPIYVGFAFLIVGTSLALKEKIKEKVSRLP